VAHAQLCSILDEGEATKGGNFEVLDLLNRWFGSDIKPSKMKLPGVDIILA
jgi:hypothetical protein